VTGLLRYQPPQEDDLVRLEVSAQTSVLRFAGKEYRSRTSLDQNALLEARHLGPQRYGRQLYEAVINSEAAAGDYLPTLTGFRMALHASRALRFQLTVSDPDLRQVGWEYLWAEKSVLPLALSERTPFYRRFGDRPLDPAPAPVRILVAVANPSTLGRSDCGNPNIAALPPLNVWQELAIATTALDRLQSSGLATFQLLERTSSNQPVTIDTMDGFLEQGCQVLHLVGHGLVLGDKYRLVLEKDSGEHAFISAEEIAQRLVGHGLRLVILAACNSAAPASEEALPGLGPKLVEAGVPAVISMQDRLPFDASQAFTQHFYDDLARSGRVDMALAATRRALYHGKYGGSWSWGIPVLQMSCADGKLFEVDEQRTAGLDELEPVIRSRDELGGEQAEVELQRRELLVRAGRLQEEELQQQLRMVSTAGTATATARLAQHRDRISRSIRRMVELDWRKLRTHVRGSDELEVPDQVLRRSAAALNTGKNVVLIGPPGTGKTTLANAIAEHARHEGFSTRPISATASADWTTFDTVGGYVPERDQSLGFHPGLFLRAIREAGWLVLDEINRADIDKAIGELFTVLAGQQVELPYTVGEHQVRVMPAAVNDLDTWVPDSVSSGFDYVVHPNWRIIATMNVYDRSTLFAMSFAFMRRFAFVDCGLPSSTQYMDLRKKWLEEEIPKEEMGKVEDKLDQLFDLSSPLMQRRELGPAIARDMIRYLGAGWRPAAANEAGNDAADTGKPPGLSELLAEAFLLYAVPQLDGLDQDGILAIYGDIAKHLFPVPAADPGKPDRISPAEEILTRIRLLYPHISRRQWQQAAGTSGEQESG
jgi:MoxR-like ATPase